MMSKRVIIEPGPRPNMAIVVIPDCVLQFMGWHEGDALDLKINVNDDLVLRWSSDQSAEDPTRNHT